MSRWQKESKPVVCSIAWVDEVFTYHAPTMEQQRNYEAIREGAKHFARVLMDNTPHCADQATSLRKLRESVMTANAAVALEGLI
jgi:hypothetical protein